jgi:hypothetical protein
MVAAPAVRGIADMLGIVAGTCAPQMCAVHAPKPYAVFHTPLPLPWQLLGCQQLPNVQVDHALPALVMDATALGRIVQKHSC